MNDIKPELEEQISASGFEKNENIQNAQLEKIRSFIDNSLKLPKTKLIETAMNMGKIAADIFLVVAIFLTLIFGVNLYTFDLVTHVSSCMIKNIKVVHN